MAGFGKKFHKLKTINPQELIDFQNRYYDNYGIWLLPESRALACVIFSFLFLLFSLLFFGCIRSYRAGDAYFC